MSSFVQNNKIFRNTLFLIVLAELLSFLGYYYPFINLLVFFLIVILTIITSLYRLEYGLYILLAELFIGSFGYLFYYESGGSKISIRLSLWLIIMSVWLAKIIILWIKNKKLSINFSKSRYFSYFVVLIIFIVWGLANGFLSGNAISNIFFDFDRWLYFLIVLPIFFVLQNSDNIKNIQRIFLAAVTWLSLKTIMLAYFFSHNFNNFILDLYRWIRNSGAGEITQVQGGFSRVFMQSHIFVLIGFFILLFYLFKIISTDKNRKLFIACFSLMILFLSAVIISFSRSFWIGLAAGGIFVLLIAWLKLKIKIKQFLIFNSIIFLGIIASLILTLAVVKFPYPSPGNGFNAAELLSQRATQITNEAGASSRWQLLNPLWQKIKTSPIMGSGFGSVVTYRTNDPRILSSSPNGLYTTYAFEWGWLDVWLKLGFLGLLAYIILFLKIITDGLKINKSLSLSLTVGLLVLMAVNIFSPYINHPLGIGYLVMAICIMDYLKKGVDIAEL